MKVTFFGVGYVDLVDGLCLDEPIKHIVCIPILIKKKSATVTGKLIGVLTGQ